MYAYVYKPLESFALKHEDVETPPFTFFSVESRSILQHVNWLLVKICILDNRIYFFSQNNTMMSFGIFPYAAAGIKSRKENKAKMSVCCVYGQAG